MGVGDCNSFSFSSTSEGAIHAFRIQVCELEHPVIVGYICCSFVISLGSGDYELCPYSDSTRV